MQRYDYLYVNGNRVVTILLTASKPRRLIFQLKWVELSLSKTASMYAANLFRPMRSNSRFLNT